MARTGSSLRSRGSGECCPFSPHTVSLSLSLSGSPRFFGQGPSGSFALSWGFVSWSHRVGLYLIVFGSGLWPLALCPLS